MTLAGAVTFVIGALMLFDPAGEAFEHLPGDGRLGEPPGDAEEADEEEPVARQQPSSAEPARQRSKGEQTEKRRKSDGESYEPRVERDQ